MRDPTGPRFTAWLAVGLSIGMLSAESSKRGALTPYLAGILSGLAVGLLVVWTLRKL